MNFPKLSVKIIIIFFFAVIIFAGAIYAWVNRQSDKPQDNTISTSTPIVSESVLDPELSQSEIPSPVADLTADWKTYRNEDNGFEIKYPPNWEIIKEKNNAFVIFADKEEAEIQKEKRAGEIRCGAGVYIYDNEKGYSLYDWAIEKWGKPEERELGKISKVKIKNFQGIKYEFISMGIETNILFSKNNRVIDITATFNSCSSLDAIFNQMLFSFKFFK